MNDFYTSELMTSFGYSSICYMTCGIIRESLQRMHTLLGMVLTFADMAECDIDSVIRDLGTDIATYYELRHGVRPTEAMDPQFVGALNSTMRWLTRHATA